MRLTGHYAAYGKLLELKPDDRALLSEIAAAIQFIQKIITDVAKTLDKDARSSS